MSTTRNNIDYDFGNLFDDEEFLFNGDNTENLKIENLPIDHNNNNNNEFKTINLDTNSFNTQNLQNQLLNNYHVLPINETKQKLNEPITAVKMTRKHTAKHTEEKRQEWREKKRKSTIKQKNISRNLELQNEALTNKVNELTTTVALIKQERDYWKNFAINNFCTFSKNLAQQTIPHPQLQNIYPPIPVQPTPLQFLNSQNYLFFDNQPSTTINPPMFKFKP